jgi:hypothetical protein
MGLLRLPGTVAPQPAHVFQEVKERLPRRPGSVRSRVRSRGHWQSWEGGSAEV